MAKFIKFPCTNTAVVAPLSPINNILVNVEDITTVTATGATGGNAKTVVIGLTGRAAQAAAAGGAGGTRLTLSVSTSTALPLVNPTLITGQQNPLVAAVRGAMTPEQRKAKRQANRGKRKELGIKAKLRKEKADRLRLVCFFFVIKFDYILIIIY